MQIPCFKKVLESSAFDGALTIWWSVSWQKCFLKIDATQFLRNDSPLMAAAVCHHLKAAFFPPLNCYFLTSASRGTSVSETGRTCLHEAANTNTDPPECICYPTTTLQLVQQTGTHTWEPWADHIAHRTQHQNLEPGKDYVNVQVYVPATSCSRKKNRVGTSFLSIFNVQRRAALSYRD